MARYLGSTCKLSRRENTDLFLKSGIRPLDSKCHLNRLPGKRIGKKRNASEYGLQLREKQKLRRIYGVLEKQFHNYYQNAVHLSGTTGDNLLQLLESRLDNVVYRMGFAVTRADARQIVSHKGVSVNGKTVNIASYKVDIGDGIVINDNIKDKLRIKISLDSSSKNVIPEWLEVNHSKMTGVFLFRPLRSSLSADINEQLVVEFYSK